MTSSPNQSQTLIDLRAFLLAILPAGVQVIQGQDNRVPEPVAGDFAVMTPVFRERLATNLDQTADCRFTGATAGTVLTVSAVQIGKLTPGNAVFGTGVALGTLVGTQITGSPGSTGTYNVSPTQTLTSRTLACGATQVTQETKLTVQLNIHGPGSADNAQVVENLFNDPYAFDFITGLGHGVAPLYANEARQLPFLNDQQQIEFQWVISLELQIDPVVSVPQQYADALTIVLKEVEATVSP